MNSLEDALKRFMDANPDLPEGVDAPEQPDNKPKKALDKLQVVIEKKGRGGKTATIITGFSLGDDEVAAIARELKSKLGTGGSSRGGEILIQGERRKEVVDFLRTKGYKVN